MLYDLRQADPRLKWLVTCLLATFGLAYLFGGWMVGLFAGFTPHAVAATYASAEMHMAIYPTVGVPTPRGKWEMARLWPGRLPWQ